ncbi:class I SAM-dependent methyltransferase [Actinocatenispora sera]|uniref:class I SAM-dependent methyltransferase n=1 Tax=Actinocatenispora sera TaxID=390989 RepID=UPI00340F3DB5
MPARRPFGAITRGTTNPNRLRRVDRYLAHRYGRLLRDAADPLVVDLGYGASPVTTLELAARLRTVAPAVRVVGLEIDPARVSTAAPAADPPRVEFRRGGFELAGLRPVLVRALNVLRQYAEGEVPAAWTALRHGLAAGGAAIDGTCDELGRLACWVTLTDAGPAGLTLAAKLSTLDSPATFAERLPKALIHRNVPGEPVHAFLSTLDDSWRNAAPYADFGVRQRFAAAVTATRAAGWPIEREPDRWRRGELTVAWPAVAPNPAR